MPATLSLRLLVGIAALALLGALGLQYLGGLQPCTLCIWARYPYLVVIAAGAAGLWLGRPRTALVVVVLALAISVGLAIYHVGVEQGVFALMESCAAVGEATTVAELKAQKGIVPGLRVIIVGDHPASRAYVRTKTRMAAEVGIDGTLIELPEDVTTDHLARLAQSWGPPPAVEAVTVFVAHDPLLHLWARVMDFQFVRRRHLVTRELEEARRLVDSRRAPRPSA